VGSWSDRNEWGRLGLTILGVVEQGKLGSCQTEKKCNEWANFGVRWREITFFVIKL
jgi:hypothetical protein